MRIIAQIIECFDQFWTRSDFHIKIENEPYMPLVIEHVGKTPDGKADQVSVAHYFEQNGDLCQDPEVLFEVVPTRREGKASWEPIFFQQASLSIFTRCLEWNDGPGWGKGGEVRRVVYLNNRRSVRSFCATWGRNIRAQGYLEIVQSPPPAKKHRGFALDNPHVEL